MKTLTDYLNIEIKSDYALMAMLEFADRYPAEVTFDREARQVTFESADWTFVIRADLNQNLDNVFQAQIISYCPRTLIFESGYYKDFEKALVAIKHHIQEM